MVFHVADELLGNFFEHLLSEVTSTDGMIEAYKLDDITLCNFSLIAKAATIAIKLLHSIEIGVTDTNNNNGAWQLCQLDDLVDSFIHIMDGTVSEN